MSKNQVRLLIGGLAVVLACTCIVTAGGVVTYTMLEKQTEHRSLVPTGSTLPTEGLVAYYPFESSAEDKSENGNHGEEYGGVKYVEGKVGEAAYFDGVDDYIEIIPQNEGLVLGDFTISAWTYLEDWKDQNSTEGDRQFIFDGHCHSKTVTSDFYREGFALIYDRNNTKEEIHSFILYDSEQYLEQNTRIDVKKRWRFVAFMRKGVDDYTYVDGQLITPTYLRDVKRDDLLDMKRRWFIGTFCGNNPYYNGGVIDYSFHGMIDEVRIYNRALSSVEIETLSNTW